MRGLLVMVVACAHPQPASPAKPAPITATPTATATEAPAPVAMPALAASPTHRVLEWLVDVITHRKGDVAPAELAEYCGKAFLGPVAGTADSFRTWAGQADGAVLERLEVDDPTYALGYLATREHRWKLIIEIDPATSKLSYLRFDPVP